ncbi:hypothetical protein QE109_09010 [Fusibacter bizertensis]|uniref:Stage 0 sporulation protein A homolog n=1 Tax=Fusibacter bizertensis TaxID=1488331 RepID=A0ABT6NCZ1_9FIRM|nr:hypothetical protein [Fusibacter bizertensis]MDH8678285.1 hypothetical protein [Fusibacter bizertensis]
MQDILLITNTDSSEGFIKELLMNTSYGKIFSAFNYSDATNLLDVHEFDLVIINAPMRTELGDRLAKYAAQRTTTSIMFIARESTYLQTKELLTNFGVLCIKKPVVVKPFQNLLKCIETTRTKIHAMEKDHIEVLPMMDEIRTIDAAKWYLISKFNISESQSARTIDSFSVERELSRYAAAESILQGAIKEL